RGAPAPQPGVAPPAAQVVDGRDHGLQLVPRRRSPAEALMVAEVRVEVRPPWPFRLGGGSMDGLTRRRGAALQRLLRIDGEPVLVGMVQPARDRVLFAARGPSKAAADAAIARMRFATGVDDDL